jgi:RHS repeat-associated protein
VEKESSDTFNREGTSVVAPVLADGSANYTPGLSERRGTTTRNYHNSLKSLQMQTDTSQNSVASRTYDAFGNVLASTGTWNGPFGYAGGFGYQEDRSGLMLLGHRYYDSSTGRFLTRDRIKDGRNWYVYAGSEPTRFSDPTGLWRFGFETGPGIVAPPFSFSFRVGVTIDHHGNISGHSTFGLGIGGPFPSISGGGVVFDPFGDNEPDEDGIASSVGVAAGGNAGIYGFGIGAEASAECAVSPEGDISGDCLPGGLISGGGDSFNDKEGNPRAPWLPGRRVPFRARGTAIHGWNVFVEGRLNFEAHIFTVPDNYWPL